MADPKDEGMTVERIPGEREPDTLTRSDVGIMGGTGYGENIPPQATDTMTERTREEREKEGGGT